MFILIYVLLRVILLDKLSDLLWTQMWSFNWNLLSTTLCLLNIIIQTSLFSSTQEVISTWTTAINTFRLGNRLCSHIAQQGNSNLKWNNWTICCFNPYNCFAIESVPKPASSLSCVSCVSGSFHTCSLLAHRNTASFLPSCTGAALSTTRTNVISHRYGNCVVLRANMTPTCKFPTDVLTVFKKTKKTLRKLISFEKQNKQTSK